ncbi:hypothetical protein HD554DRAFT_2166870 [Boletus coccyginus]|nr:hypothetical protein HD554DRAFT_2166870 [Boletus coccyginus]
MFTTLFSLSLFIALIQSVLAQSDLEINTPIFVQCQPIQITWTASNNPPYGLLVVSAQDLCGEAIQDLGNQTSTAMTWTVNLAAGTQVALFLEDAAGNDAWSGTITVGDSNDTSCLTSIPAVSGTALTVPPTGGAATPSAPSSPTSSAFTPSGVANAGMAPASGALSMRPLSTLTLLASTVLAVVAFTL